MARDKTGNRYEQLLEASLLHLGYAKDSDSGLNYIRPPARGPVIIPGTFIQPDIVVRQGTQIQAILYVTHWSNRRNSNFKFWRTWEELAQQKLIVGTHFISINCLFEALAVEESPKAYVTSDEIPPDPTRDDGIPIAFNGWYGAISWALVESFDVSLVFPNNYNPCSQKLDLLSGEHDLVTSNLLSEALSTSSKSDLTSQWYTLSVIRSQAIEHLPTSLEDTQSRYRIGLLHVYLIYRIFHYLNPENQLDLDIFVNTLVSADANYINLNTLADTSAFSQIPNQKLIATFAQLSQIYVRKSKDTETLCTMTSFNNPILGGGVHRIKFNQDLRLCLQDLGQHLAESGFIVAIHESFDRFDQVFGINECFEDLADQNLVIAKEEFVRNTFSEALKSYDDNILNELLQAHGRELSHERILISEHQQNWVLEMILYLAGLTSDEDIQTKLKANFEALAHPHALRTHAPYGDEGKLIRYLLQGRDICGHWSSKSKKYTLSQEDFRVFSWQTVSRSIFQSFQEKGQILHEKDEVIRKYIQNKSMRIIGSDLNGMGILIDHYLGNLCHLQSTDEAEHKEALSARLCNSWQTDLINNIWNGRPLETWMEGVSHNGQWLIKIQSAQDGHESDKTKELAGRCRAMRLQWAHGDNPHDRTQWSFSERPMPRLALILDGDWDANKKRNLYEAGWDWVGDVSQLQDLRDLIQQS